MPGNLTPVTETSGKAGGVALWLSDVEQLGEADNEWGFTVYADKDVFLATFVYPGRELAEAARQAIVPALKDAVFIATEAS